MSRTSLLNCHLHKNVIRQPVQAGPRNGLATHSKPLTRWLIGLVFIKKLDATIRPGNRGGPLRLVVGGNSGIFLGKRFEVTCNARSRTMASRRFSNNWTMKRPCYKT